MHKKELGDLRGLSELVQWLADTHHDGTLLSIAERMSMSSGVVYQWAKGTTRVGRIETLSRLANAYGLDLADVVRIVQKQPTERPKPALKLAVAKPPTSDKKRSSKSRKIIAAIPLALALYGAMQPPAVGAFEVLRKPSRALPPRRPLVSRRYAVA